MFHCLSLPLAVISRRHRRLRMCLHMHTHVSNFVSQRAPAISSFPAILPQAAFPFFPPQMFFLFAPLTIAVGVLIITFTTTSPKILEVCVSQRPPPTHLLISSSSKGVCGDTGNPILPNSCCDIFFVCSAAEYNDFQTQRANHRLEALSSFCSMCPSWFRKPLETVGNPPETILCLSGCLF